MSIASDKNASPRGVRSRLDTSRRNRIAKMVDGYSSTITAATAMRNLFAVWLVPTAALVVLGLFALGRKTASDGEGLVRAIRGVEAAISVMWLVTLFACIVYGSMNWSNVRCVGKSTRFGFVATFVRHIKAVFVGIFLLVFGGLIPGLGPALFLAGALMLSYGVLVFWAVTYGLVKMFWRAGSPPVGVEESLPHWAVGWFASLLLFSTLSGFTGLVDSNPTLFALLCIGAGLSGFVAAALAGKLVVSISQRLDARMVTILARIDDDPDEKARLVTTKQLEAAWDSSESLVQFDHLG